MIYDIKNRTGHEDGWTILEGGTPHPVCLKTRKAARRALMALQEENKRTGWDQIDPMPFRIVRCRMILAWGKP